MSANSAQSQPEKTPAAKPPDEQKQYREHKEQERQQLNALIGQHVLQTLGQPDDLFQVQVRPLFQGRYRVNIFIGMDAASVKVGHSYFLVADSEGNILASTPELTKRY